LSYQVQNATTVSISGIGNVNPNNSNLPVGPAQTTTYTLTATNANGTQTATASVTVVSPPPQLAVCTAVPMTILSGESTTLYYQLVNATSVTSSPPVGGNLGRKWLCSSNTEYKHELHHHREQCERVDHVYHRRHREHQRAKPGIVNFSRSPLTIARGGTSTLVWTTKGATAV